MNQILIRLVLSTAVTLSLFSPANAAKVFSGQYLPSIMPNTKVTYWKPLFPIGNSSLSIKHGEAQLNNGDAFYIDTTSSLENLAYFSKSLAVKNGDRLELEAKVKLDSFTGDTGCGGNGLGIEDDINSEFLIIRPDGIYTFNSHSFYAMNTMDNYHVYRIVAQGNNVKVYVDGGKSPIIDAAFSPTFWQARHMVAFGDGSGCASTKSSWAYAKYKAIQIVPR